VERLEKSRGVTIARRIPGAVTALSVCCNFSQARRCIPLDNSVFSVSHNASLDLCISGWFRLVVGYVLLKLKRDRRAIGNDGRERGFGRTGMAPTQERKCPLSGRSQKSSLSESGRPHPKYLKRETGFTLLGFSLINAEHCNGAQKPSSCYTRFNL